MAFIHVAGGWVIKVPSSRESVMASLDSSPHGAFVTFEVDYPAGGAKHGGPVTVNAAQVVVVSDQRLPPVA